MLEPGFEQGYEEKIDTTHRCANPKCNRRFRDTPPAHEEKTP